MMTPLTRVKQRKLDRRGGGSVIMGEETRVMQPQAKGHQKLEEAKKDPLLEALEGAQPCQHLDLRLLISRTI